VGLCPGSRVEVVGAGPTHLKDFSKVCTPAFSCGFEEEARAPDHALLPLEMPGSPRARAPRSSRTSVILNHYFTSLGLTAVRGWGWAEGSGVGKGAGELAGGVCTHRLCRAGAPASHAALIELHVTTEEGGHATAALRWGCVPLLWQLCLFRPRNGRSKKAPWPLRTTPRKWTRSTLSRWCRCRVHSDTR
jgi:hypothetical protein